MREFVVYTVSRIGLFVATYAVVVGVYLLVTGDRSVPLWWPFLAAAVVSAIASVYLLRGQRDRLATRVEQRAAAAARRVAAARAEEDRPDR